MSDEAKRYNGYANYETWCVTLWLENDQGSVEYWRDEARRHRKEAPRCEQVQEGLWTAQQAERFRLADQLKESFEDFHPFRGEHLAKPKDPDVYSELLDAALSEVDWHEVAEAFLDGLEPEDDGPDGRDDDDEEEKDEDAEAFEQQKRERLENPKGPLFELGQVMSTPGALKALTSEDIRNAVGRHHRGDWGDVKPDGWRENELSLREGFRLVSVYHAANAVKFWVITEADRSSTCVLLPDEY
jgi:hypothetical protein